jgi:hypothetical protein
MGQKEIARGSPRDEEALKQFFKSQKDGEN